MGGRSMWSRCAAMNNWTSLTLVWILSLDTCDKRCKFNVTIACILCGAQHHAQGQYDRIRRRPPGVVGAVQARGAREPVARQARVRDVRQFQGATRRRAGEWLPALLRQRRTAREWARARGDFC